MRDRTTFSHLVVRTPLIFENRWIPRKAAVIGLETSKALPHAPQGKGPIIRVGDKTSIFDDAATAALVQAAADAKLPHQRCLMSGGTCEAMTRSLRVSAKGKVQAIAGIAFTALTQARAEAIVKAHVAAHSDLMAIPAADRAAAHGK